MNPARITGPGAIKLKELITLLLTVIIIYGCNSPERDKTGTPMLAEDVKNETIRAWQAYTTYAWGHDELLPLSRGYNNWYDEPMYISLIDAYSTLKIMGFEDESERIEVFVADTISFDKDIFVKTFEINIRVLGGLLSMYDLTGNEKILDKARDLADRMMPAFGSPTGLPWYYVNLRTGEVRGEVICVAEAGTFIVEMGVLSYYTKDPKYYQAAKNAAEVIYSSRSPIGLISQDYNVITGEPLDSLSHVGCFIDSYYEYLYKGWLLFGDPELKEMWETSIEAINRYIAVETETTLWYGAANAHTGEQVTSHDVTLWDAFFPLVLISSGDTARAAKSVRTWDGLWSKHGLLPMGYNFHRDEITNPRYYLNPELIESAYYMYHYTQEKKYLEMIKQYWEDIKNYCRTDIAFTHIEDVVTKEQSDQMSTFLFAETLKYFYLAFSGSEVNPENYVFNTEAHPYRIANIDSELVRERLGFK
ncbi:MAG: glycoside hydrolase family 47 protein [Marinilabiliales bacterium]|nr:MAG: glycoside hydrolase family 47 protein [Marinilabiliales bacterium]